MPGPQRLRTFSNVAAAVTTAAALVASSSARADDADLRLRPDEGQPGDTVTARGSGFAWGEAGDLIWLDDDHPGGLELVDFVADDEGSFEATFTVPDVAPGEYEIAAVGESTEATTDTFEVEIPDEDADGGSENVPTDPPPDLPAVPPPGDDPLGAPAPDSCGTPGRREVTIANSDELSSALGAAAPGDRITLADGIYPGNFVAAVDGTADQRISLCGGRGAILDGGDWEASGYGLHLQGDHWTVSGITVTNAQKGIVGDGVTGVVLTGLDVHGTGHEAIHFRTHSTDNVVQFSDVHDTGLDNEKFGEGVYLGSAVSNWERYTHGRPDLSNGNRVLHNRIWATTSESVDVKEGTEDGVVAGNVFDGSGLVGADSWVDVKGRGYLIIGNIGTDSPQDGFQTHVIDDMEWGTENDFVANTANVDGPGVGFYIHDAQNTTNVVACDNIVTGAAGGVSNLPGGCNG